MWNFCCDQEGNLNEDKLGMILGHEMAHAILFQTAEKLSLTNLTVLAVKWAFIPSDGITHWFFKKAVDIFIEMPFSRDMELEADADAMPILD